MKNIKPPFHTIKKWAIKLLRRLLYLVAILPVAILALLHLPPVQRQLLSSLCRHLHTTTHYHIQCDALRLTWLQYIVLEGITVTDPDHKPVFALGLGKVKLNLLDLFLLKPNMIHSVSLTGGAVYLEKNMEQVLNIQAFYAKAILPFVPASKADVFIHKIELCDINLFYRNQVAQQSIEVNHIVLVITQFRCASDHYSGKLTHLSYQETDDLPLLLRNLVTEFTIEPHSITLKKCHLVTKYSELKGDFTLRNTKQLSLFTNHEEIVLDAILDKTALSSLELSKFFPFFKGIDTLYKLDGALSLSPCTVAWKHCKLVFGGSDSYLKGSGYYRLSAKRAYAEEFVGDTERWNWSVPSVREDLSTGSTSKLPAEERSRRKSYDGVDLDLSIESGKLHISDLRAKLPTYLHALQYIGITHATLVGNSQKAQLTGAISTHIGAVQTDLTLHHFGKPDQNVMGNLTLDKVAIDVVLPGLPIRSLSGQVGLKARGTHFTKLDVMADLSQIKTDHYSYKGIKAFCAMAGPIATFSLDSADPNAKLKVAGSYHTTVQQSLKAHGTIEQLHLQKLGLISDPLLCGTHFSLKIKNILTKRPRGHIILNQCIIEGVDKKMVCKDLAIHAIEEKNKDVLILTSPFIDGRLEGKFTMSDLVHHGRNLIERLRNPTYFSTRLSAKCAYAAEFVGDTERSNRSVLAVREDLSTGSMSKLPAEVAFCRKSFNDVHVGYTINCKKILPVLNWFSNALYISPATTFSGHFTYDSDYHFSLNLPTISTLSFRKCSLTNVQATCKVRHLTDAKRRLVKLYIASDKQDWRQMVQTDHLSLQLLIDKNKFSISNRLSNERNHLSLAFLGKLMGDAIHIDLLPSSLTTKEKVWTIQAERTSVVSKSAIYIGNLSITHGQASICMGGTLTQSSTTDPLHCTIRHLALDYNSPVGLFKAIVDTKLVAHLQKKQLIATGKLSLKKVTIQDYGVGTLRTKVDWNLVENKLALTGTLQKADKHLLQIAGSYYLTKPCDNLAITTIFNQMDLDLLNPFFDTVCSDINGKLSGQFQLTGSLRAPKVNGQGTIHKGKVTVNYLKTSYQATGTIKVQENRLYVQELALRDSASGHATLSGHITLENSFPIMVSGHMKALHLLNTTRMHNPDFYGELYATGDLQMEGSIYDLLLKMQVTADKGSFTIVAHDKENIDNATKLVQFIHSAKKNQPEKLSKDEDVSTIKLLLELKILPAVKAQIIFGSSYSDMNDILQGQGSGTIQLEVGTNRKPYVMGNYLFQDGTYTVSVYNLIRKTFTIAANSQVNFNGYPQEGIAHIEASYSQIASVAELCPQSKDMRPIPVEIALSAYGKLAHPHIAYQILFPVKSMDFELNSALEECASKALLDKNYLNKQILSLLIGKRIYNEKEIDGRDALRNSINDLLSERIQNLVSKINDNLEIETDLGINVSKSQQENIFQQTKIKVSYLLLSERLKLSSTVGRLSRFINDWEISYRIAEAYNMHAKLYQQPLQSREANLALFGITFAYTKKFW